jgi:DNA-binding MarR family transcriptional regulator
MDPIGRELNPEERSVLTVLLQEGRGAGDCTASGVATSLERDPVDVAGVLTRLERDGLTAKEPAPVGGDCWRATEGASQVL